MRSAAMRCHPKATSAREKTQSAAKALRGVLLLGDPSLRRQLMAMEGGEVGHRSVCAAVELTSLIAGGDAWTTHTSEKTGALGPKRLSASRQGEVLALAECLVRASTKMLRAQAPIVTLRRDLAEIWRDLFG